MIIIAIIAFIIVGVPIIMINTTIYDNTIFNNSDYYYEHHVAKAG